MNAFAQHIRRPEEMTALLQRRVESHLQMMWVQTAWVDRKAVDLIDQRLQPLISSMLDPDETLSTGDVLEELRRELLGYFIRCHRQRRLVEDELIQPVVARFGSVLLEFTDDLPVSSAHY